MEPTSELINALFSEKVLRARRSPIAEKLVAGPRLFVYACEAMRAGIRAQQPTAAPEEVEMVLKARLNFSRRLREAGRG